MAEVIGLDHVYLSVSNLERSVAFYDEVMKVLGFRKNTFDIAGDPHVQYFNRHFGVVLRPGYKGARHDPNLCGLHHLCLRVDSIAEVEEVANALRAAGIAASAAQRYPEYAADYWATHFTDPDGIRLEVTNYRQERRDRHDRWSIPAG
jgi:catechol 2,3-dioxygenase-like lactoylglutathione lyase family enzyme